MIERVSTGISWFDELVSDGLPKNKVTMISGESGVGKTLFALHFIKAGLYMDEKIIYFTAKDSPKQLLKDALYLGWDLQWALDQERLLLIDVKDYFWNTTEEDLQSSLMTNYIQEVRSIIKSNEAKRCVFDPAIPLPLMAFPSYCSKFMSDLVRELEQPSLNVSTMLINNQDEHHKLLNSNLASNVVKMFFKKQEDSYKRTIFIQKMQNTYYQPREYFFDIIHNDGIVQRNY